MAMKLESEVFNGKGDFLLWRKKRRVVLVQMKVAKAIDGSYRADVTEDKKLEIDEIGNFSP